MKVPSGVFISPRLSVQFKTTWYSPGWITLLRELASLKRVLENCSVNAFLVENAALLKVMSVTGNGLLSGKVALSGAFPFASTGPTMVWKTPFVPVGHGLSVLPLMGDVSVPVAGRTVSVPVVPGGTVALAAPLASNADPAVTAATATPDMSRINIFLFCTGDSLSEEKGPNWSSRGWCHHMRMPRSEGSG